MLGKFKGGSSGPYPQRAEALLSVLQPAMAEVFGLRIPFRKRDSGEHLQYIWALPERVSVMIEKSSGADPQIQVARPDPKGNGFPDFKNWFGLRSTFDGSYDLADVVERAKAAVEYNRQKREETEALEATIAKELEGLELPEGARLDRDAKTALYKLTVVMEVTNLKIDTVRRIVDALRMLKEEVKIAQGS